MDFNKSLKVHNLIIQKLTQKEPIGYQNEASNFPTAL